MDASPKLEPIHMLDEGRMNRVKGFLEAVSLVDGGHFHFISCTRIVF